MWPFRRRPLSDIAQAVLDLLQDEAGWKPGLLALRHERADVTIRCTGVFTSVTAGAASLRLEGRDRRAVDRAYTAFRKRREAEKRALKADRVREAMALPTAQRPEQEPESIAELEARVRRLREAMAVASSAS